LFSVVMLNQGMFLASTNIFCQIKTSKTFNSWSFDRNKINAYIWCNEIAGPYLFASYYSPTYFLSAEPLCTSAPKFVGVGLWKSWFRKLFLY
jgi:hypothetical protein